MNIVSALMNQDSDLRIVNGDKWLYFDGDEWFVAQRKYRKKNTIILISSLIQDDAIKVLLEG